MTTTNDPIQGVEWRTPDGRNLNGAEPRFALACELIAPGPDGRSHVATTVTFDGTIVGVINADIRAEGADPEFCARGVSVREPKSRLGYIRSTAIANTRAMETDGEPDEGSIAAAVIYAELLDDAYGFVRWSANGTPVPTGLLPAFYDALPEACDRLNRPIVNDRLTGEPRSW